VVDSGRHTDRPCYFCSSRPHLILCSVVAVVADAAAIVVILILVVAVVIVVVIIYKVFMVLSSVTQY